MPKETAYLTHRLSVCLTDSRTDCLTAVHFGMAGFFGAVVGKPEDAPLAKETTRLTLTNKDARLTAHLSAMTVKQGGVGETP